MRRIILLTIIAALTLFGCGSGATVKHDDPKVETHFYVTFEGNPKVDEGEQVMRGDLVLGRVLTVTIPNSKAVVVQIGISAGNEIWLRDNVVFYLQNNQLYYAELTEKGKLLDVDAKILGFAGKAQLYWFKTKVPVNDVVRIAQIKAKNLFRQAAL